MSFATVSISALATSHPDGAAAQAWSGFLEFRSSREAASARPAHMLGEGGKDDWVHALHWKKPRATVDPIGCFLLRDVEVWRPGILVHGGQVVDDANLSTNVALSMARADANFASRFSGAAARHIDRPALVVAGPGCAIWGHWLVEFLPRVSIASQSLASLRDEWVIPLPHDTPSWVEDLLLSTCNVRPDAILRYTPGRERLLFARAVVPTFCFSGEYTFHPYLREFYRSLVPASVPAGRRLCLSRGGPGPSANRPFRQRDFFEQEARRRGFEVIRPEELNLPEQIATLSQANALLGEYGSALHGSVFAGPGTVVGCIGHWNAVQMRLSDVLEQQGVYLTRGCLWPTADRPMSIDASQDDIESFLDRVTSLLD
ncbi:glycosyltransferase family 61 protein [Labrys sp. ZIDIC5]|uniref:glycosyltransferase family 61 protein n=1 Tax=Labrys sedimenti TaxID=3106036 RepID=UPI002ACAC093|nr:glycosyltransferase family 61 protein [Labrys sp. ZIDIC5]MDZ5448383.1 glycosyltransferase family 61 protein [Labrys sp. ZIDIC5]